MVGFGSERELGAGVAPEFARDPERVKAAEPVPVFEQVLVVDGKERTLQRRKHGQLVVGPLDRGERRTNRFDFLAVVKRLSTDEQMRNAARLQRRDVRTRRVFRVAREAAEQHRNVPRLDRDPFLAAVGAPFRNLPATVVNQPADEGANSVGQRSLDGPAGHGVAGHAAG